MSNKHLESYINLEAWAGVSTPNWVSTNKATLTDSPKINEELWRKQTTSLLKELFIKLNIAINPHSFIEIGAHEGSISLDLKKIGVKNIFAIEANPYVFDEHRERLEANGVQYLNFAISSSNSPVQMNIPKFSETLARPDSSLLKRTAGAEYEEIYVESKSLSTFIEEKSLSHLSLWIDTEGLSLQILESAKIFINQVQLIHVEVEDIGYWQNQSFVTDVFEFCYNNGFLAIARDMDGRGQFNVIFIRDKYIKNIGGLISDYWKNISSLKTSFEKNRKKSFFARLRGN